MCYSTFEVILLEEKDIKEWMNKNLVGKEEAINYTNQSVKAFEQSVRTNKITPFFETKGSNTRSKIRLYSISELIAYGENKRKNRSKKKTPEK